jgi:hypothetical protein
MSFKVRRKLLAQGGLQVGADGGTANSILFGSACIACGTPDAGESVSACVAISGVADGDYIFVQPFATLPDEIILYSACAVDGGISASFVNAGSANCSSSCDIGVNYLVLS